MIGFHSDDVVLLSCPSCSAKLEWTGREEKGMLHHGRLKCKNKKEHHSWKVESGVPNLADRGQLSSKDQLMDVVYDLLAPVHDASVTYLLPALQYPDPHSSRDNYIQAMQLSFDADSKGAARKKAAKKKVTKEPIKILEVGVGTGANIPLISHAARKSKREFEIWAVDLNSKMIQKCAESNRSKENLCVKLALADAHDLPFENDTFDRVLHVGGINIYRDPERGLAEMARVAKRDTPIVVVDEGLDKKRDNTALHQIAFLWLTSLDEIREVPIDLIPDNCEIVDVFNVSRFYYCLVYKKTK